MKKLLEGFIDCWKVLVINGFRREGKDPFIDWFDIGVLLAIVSMMALLVGIVLGLTKLIPL